MPIEYTNSNISGIAGGFKKDKTRYIDNVSYKIFIELRINCDAKKVDSIKTEIESIISHELNHAYGEIKKIGKMSRANVLNKTKNATNFELSSLLKQHPALKDFMYTFYLALPQEINAAVQQTATDLKYIKSKDYNETTESLLKYRPLNNAKKMQHYNLNDIKTVDRNVLAEFVNKFNFNLKSFSSGLNIRTANDVDAFFSRWLKQINISGHELFKRIMKLVADKHNISEAECITNLDSKLFLEITGKFLDNYLD